MRVRKLGRWPLRTDGSLWPRRALQECAGFEVGALEGSVLDISAVHGRVDDLLGPDRVLRQESVGRVGATGRQGDDQCEGGSDAAVGQTHRGLRSI